MKMSEKRALVKKRQKAQARELVKKQKEEERAEKKRRRETAVKSIKSHKAEDMIQYDILQIFPDARQYKTTLTKKFVNRKVWKKPDIQQINSVLPGVVTSLNVKKGDHVTKGDHILTFEAMKMQNIILAPFDGTVSKINIKEGTKVPKGVAILLIKPDIEPEIHKEETTSTDLGLIV